MQFPFQFHKRKLEIAPFLHFSTLRANRKSEIGNHWVISDFWFPITPMQVHPRAEKMEQSARPRYLYACTCILSLLFSWAINSKSGLFIYLFIYLFTLYLSIFVISFFLCFCSGRSTCTCSYIVHVRVHRCCLWAIVGY